MWPTRAHLNCSQPPSSARRPTAHPGCDRAGSAPPPGAAPILITAGSVLLRGRRRSGCLPDARCSHSCSTRSPSRTSRATRRSRRAHADRQLLGLRDLCLLPLLALLLAPIVARARPLASSTSAPWWPVAVLADRNSRLPRTRENTLGDLVHIRRHDRRHRRRPEPRGKPDTHPNREQRHATRRSCPRASREASCEVLDAVVVRRLASSPLNSTGGIRIGPEPP